jgi:hypothetical protein
MSDRFTIAFTDAAGAVQGVAISGVGTLLRVGDQPAVVAAAPQVIAEPGGWRLSGAGYELGLRPLGDATAVPASAQLWQCQARGSIGATQVDAVGVLTSAPPTPEQPSLERSVSVSFDGGPAFALTAQRPRTAHGHGEEVLAGVAFRGEPPAAVLMHSSRLSTTYGADGLPIHLGIELWEAEDAEFALRIGGEVLATVALPHPDGGNTTVALIDFHHEGRRARGSYTLTTAA